MILPSHLNTLLDMLPSGKALVIDMRTPSEFAKSHIHGAVNLRIPARFARNADLPMLEQAFPDDQSRRAFSSWQSAQCIVFYDRSIDDLSDCPVAEIFHRKFRGWGWEGQCLVLKGPFKEFSVSYSRYIVGTMMTQEAKDYVDGLREKPTSREEQLDSRRRYDEWLALLLTAERVIPRRRSDGGPGGGPAPGSKSLADQQRDLEAEFERRFPGLARKAAEVYGAASAPGSPLLEHRASRKADHFSTKAGMVEYLDRGLTAIREGKAAPLSPTTTTTTPPLPQQQQQRQYDAAMASKLAADASYFDTHPRGASRPPSDDFVKISKGDGQDEERTGAADDGGSRGRSGFLNKVLRRT